MSLKTPPPALEAPIKSDVVTILEPARGWQPINFAELWHYSELLWFMALRDIQVRYKQTVLGLAWAIIQPVCTMLVFSIFFGKFGKIPSDGLPYPVFVFCALLPWQLFANTMGQAGSSLVTNANLLKKVYFPRLIIPLAAALSGVVDFAVAFVVLLAMMLCYGIVPGWAALTVPLFLLFAVTAALSVGLWLSALNVQYRDVRYAIPFLTQIWLFVTPVAYPSSMVPDKWRLLYALNPMAGVVEGFRWALLGKAAPPVGVMLVSFVATLVLLIGGLFYFRRMEDTFADVA